MSIKSNELEAFEIRDTFIIRFTRPEIRNPLSVNVLDQIEAILDGLDPRFQQLVFTGSESAFASGADLREIADLSGEAVRAFSRRGQNLMSRIDSAAQRTFAAINGYCFGGALDLALACSHRIAVRSAQFAHPGAGLGIITGWSGTQRLPRLIGQANAMEMFFTASPIDAERALAIGLVDLVTDDIFRNELLELDWE